MTRTVPHFSAVAVTAAIFVLIQLGGLLLVSPLIDTDDPVATEPGGATLGIIFIAALLVITALMLAAFRWGLTWIIRGMVFAVAFVMIWVVSSELLRRIPRLPGVDLLAAAIAAVLIGVLITYPRWYVLNIVGVIVGIGAVALLGMSLGIQSVFVLLVLLAIYDAISVYGTKHMLSLAEGAIKGKLPVVLIIPLRLPFEMDVESDTTDSPDALMIGLGDAVIPGMLAISAAIHGPIEPTMIAGIPVAGPHIGVMVGTVIALIGLFVIPSRERAHPGLPFLSTGAIAGYLVGSLLVGIGPIEAIMQ